MEEEIIIPEEETFDYHKLRYILDKDGYVCHASLGGLIICDLGECTEYKGEIPEGYETIETWYEAEIDKLNAWKIVEGNLVYDENKYNELQAQYEKEVEENATATHGWVRSQLGAESSIINDEFSKNVTGTSLVKIEDSGEYEIPNIALSSSTDGNVNMVSSNKNLLGIDAVTKTVNGVTFTVNADGSITLNGTSTADIEFDLKGASTSLEMLFLIKNGLEYIISGLTNNVSLSLYSYDGTDRTLVGNYGNGVINLSSSEIITQSTLKIANGKIFSNVTITPQVEIGNVASSFIKHNENRGTITIESGVGVLSNELQSYEPITVLMADKEVNISVDYFRHKYLENKFSEIEKTNDEIKLSVGSLNEDLQPIGDAEGIGELKLPDSAGEDLIEFVVEGKSEQATRSGKNLLKIENSINITTDGVTFAGKYDINGYLEYINVTGNSTTGYRDVATFDISSLPTGDYIINGLGTNKIIRFVLLKQGNTSPKIITTNTDVTFTQDSSSPYVALRIDLYQTGDINCQIKPMIRLASITDNAYESYGVCPSLNYPSKIKSISGIKNLFNKESSFTRYTDANVEILETGVKIIATKTTQHSSGIYIIRDLTGLEGKKITASCYAKSSSKNEGMIFLRAGNSNGSGGSTSLSPEILEGKITVSLTVPSSLTDSNKYLSLGVFATRSTTPAIGDYVEYTDLTVNISDDYEQYVPYGSNYLVEKIVGKNKFNSSLLEIAVYNLGATGTVPSKITSTTRCAISPINAIKVQPNTVYTVSIPANSQIAIGELTKDRLLISQSGWKTTTTYTFTTSSTTEYLCMNFMYGNSATITNDILEIFANSTQLELGSEATEYEEYKEAISLIDLKNDLNELRSVGEVKDELIIKNGHGTINKKIGITDLSGYERGWGKWTGTPPTGYSVFYVQDYKSFFSSTTNLMCNSFECVENPWLSGKNAIGLQRAYKEIYISIESSIASTVDELKAWLKNNRVRVQYELATPQTIDLGEVAVQTVQSDCTLTLEEEVKTNMYAKYVRYTPYNEAYITRSEAKAEIKLTKDEIELKVSKDDVVSTINQSAEQITLKGNRVVIESDKFDLNADGTIEATGGTIGGFSLNSKEFYTDIYAPYDYTEGDITKIRNYLLGTGTLTEAEKIKYDLDGDGEINTYDLFVIRNYILHGLTTTTPAKLKINSKDITRILQLVDGNGKDIFRMGLFGMEASNITNDCGSELIEPTANAVTSVDVVFNKTFSSPPQVVVTPVTGGPFTYVKGCSVSNVTTTGFKIHLYRTDTTATSVNWIAMSN